MDQPLQQPESAPVSMWDCHVHGLLPLCRFGKEDLSRNRHRCKSCLADKMAAYRARQPLRHMWNRFVQCAREHFNCDAVDGLCWIEHGQPLLSKLVGGNSLLDTRMLQGYKLAWMPGPVLDLQQVQLVKKRSRLTQAKGDPNAVGDP